MKTFLAVCLIVWTTSLYSTDGKYYLIETDDGTYQTEEYGENYYDDEKIEIEQEWTNSSPRLHKFKSGPKKYSTPRPQKIEYDTKKYKAPKKYTTPPPKL